MPSIETSLVLLGFVCLFYLILNKVLPTYPPTYLAYCPLYTQNYLYQKENNWIFVNKFVFLITLHLQCPHEGCGKCFTTAYNLKTHIKAHFRTDSHACRYDGCDKTFPTAHKLKVHERRHQTENKPYRCETEGCGKVFSAHGTLASHRKTHSGDRPYPCPAVGCGKRFTKASKLKLHLRSHTGERPFHCEVEVESLLTSTSKVSVI